MENDENEIIENLWQLDAIRVTKYNPVYRKNDGSYPKIEWTEYGDVGRSFDSAVFTKEEYLQTEKKYISSIKLFLNYVDCTTIELEDLHIISDSDFFYKKGDEELLKYYGRILVSGIKKEPLVIAIDEIDGFAKLILRTYLQGTIKGNKNLTYVRFGYDYYMYLNSNKPIDKIFDQIHKLGLFVG